MAKAIFEQIFEGPDSVFGRIFGPSEEAMDEAKKLIRRKVTRTVRFKLSPAQIEILQQGGHLTFSVGNEKFVITREEVQ